MGARSLSQKTEVMVLCAKDFCGARDEHTISAVPSRANLFASAFSVGLAGGGPSSLFHCGNRGHAGCGELLRVLRRRWAAQQSLRSQDAAEGAGVRLREWGVQFT